MGFNAPVNTIGAKIFGREPAFWVSTLETGFTLLLAFHVLSQQMFGLIFPVVTAALGLYVAWITKETVLTSLTGFVKSALAALVIFGWTLTDAQTAGILAFISLVAGAYVRDRNYPLAYPPVPTPGAIPVSDVGAH